MIGWSRRELIVSPYAGSVLQPTPKPLAKYAFRALKKQNYPGSEIVLDRVLKEDPEFTSFLFFVNSDGKKVSGLANIPSLPGVYPVIVMFRGYIDQAVFTTGMGTKNTAEALARRGFITLAPDFLGYGESDDPSAEPIEERFQTYTTALNLLASIKSLPQALTKVELTSVRADLNKTGIWGHSNGGHIALVVLEITGRDYPTVLWAPVSKSFPYSILYYTDEFEDRGKALRKVVAEFEKDYDAEDYNPSNFYDWLNAPIQLHQGGADEAVPQPWSDELYRELQGLNLEISYFAYPGDDHNFAQGNWSLVVERNINFYQANLAGR